MPRKTTQEGKHLGITAEKESWGSFTLSDGTKVRYKTVMLDARKVEGETGYRFDATIVFDIGSKTTERN